jgi:hypothetical protein
MENKLPKCYIWDIDGTVAKRVARQPFDFTTVNTDEVKINMQKLYQDIYNGESEFRENRAVFFFITGRSESCRIDTENWLKKYDFRYDKLLMRPLNNKDIDSSIKLTCYREYIEGKYDVISVFEDSKRCVGLYRDYLKLTCIQVDTGNF